MVQLIVGQKGKGKTKYLLDRANSEVKQVPGSIVYLDKSAKHMFELNNKVRLIDVSDFAIGNSDEFVGFVCGIISQDHDLEQMYFDSFLKLSGVSSASVLPVVNRLEKLSGQFGIDFILSLSCEASELDEALLPKIAARL